MIIGEFVCILFDVTDFVYWVLLDLIWQRNER